MKIQAHFTPEEDIEPMIIDLIDSAEKIIRLQGYGFTSIGIANALIVVYVRGVDVRVILDGPNETEKYSQGRNLSAAGVPVLYDRSHAISHNKILVIDNKTVVTGSYNWTKGAREANAENIIIVRDPATARLYAANWDFHASHSLPPGSHKRGDARPLMNSASSGYGDAEPIDD